MQQHGPPAGEPLAPAPGAVAGVDPHDRTLEHDRGATSPSAGPDPVDRITRDARSRSMLLLATAILSALSFLLLLFHLLADGGDGAGAQPVIVEGVQCLVAESQGEGEESLLYCQR